MGFWQEVGDIYGIRERGRRARAAYAREVQDRRDREALDLKRREVEALEKIALTVSK